MANEQELTGMDLFKVLLDRDKKKLPMSADERRWFEVLPKSVPLKD